MHYAGPVLARGLAVLILLVASGIPVAASAGEQPPVAPAPPPGPEDAAGVVRLRCAAEGESSVGRKDVLIRRDGNVHFRIDAGFPADLLYARRPKDIGTSRGTDLPSPPKTGTFPARSRSGEGIGSSGALPGRFRPTIIRPRTTR